MLKTRDAAKLLGLAPTTLRILVREGRIPCYRPGRHARFDEHELRAWLASRRVTDKWGPQDGSGAMINHLQG